MKTGNHSNALLVELLIVVMFFMLAATVLMQVFAKARTVSDRARLIADAAAGAQTQADRLYAAEDPEAALREMGFTADASGWIYDGGDYLSTVTLENGEDGFTRQVLTVRDRTDEVLLTLPCSRWREVAP